MVIGISAKLKVFAELAAIAVSANLERILNVGTLVAFLSLANML